MPSKLSDYSILTLIGSGSYGKCLKVRRKSDGKVLVWKDMDYGTMTEPEKQQLVSEVNLLRELKHRYIVRYHDRIIDRSRCRLYLIMEYCAGGDLASMITQYRKDRCFMDETFIVKTLAQLALALQTCHGQRRKSGNQGKIVHRDLKPANVFLDENRNVKLGDFGLARVLNHDTSFAKTFVGTPYYMSPEQMSKIQYNEKSDIWSLGCLVYELCALVPPFTAPNQQLLAIKIKQGQFRRIPSRYTDALQNCVSSMLRITPNARPSLEEIMQLPLLKDALKECSDEKATEKCPTPPVTENTNVLANKDVKENNRKTSSSSSSSTEEVKRASSDTDIKEREQVLEDRLRDVERRERTLVRRERNLEDREKAAEEKLKTAESLIKQYQEMRKDQNLLRAAVEVPKYDTDMLSHKKHVHFSNDLKENNPAHLGVDKYKLDGFKRIEAISKGNLDDYRKRLRDLQGNDDLERNKYKTVSRLKCVRNAPGKILGMR
ncbi:serine/threonine-protein kinase Nek2-like [Clavelina lepadiformis]|uniref:serine/threonine-protein kinase Nek2-like n=1 Tax=Clavelina lepadiformis TaxID=159417 RepID=UPI0040425E3B